MIKVTMASCNLEMAFVEALSKARSAFYEKNDYDPYQMTLKLIGTEMRWNDNYSGLEYTFTFEEV